MRNALSIMAICGFAFTACQPAVIKSPHTSISAASATPAEIETLVDQLQTTNETGYGYSANFSGSAFLPYPDSAEVDTLVFGGSAPQPSPPMEKLVRLGVVAVPALLKHLDDARPCNIPAVSGMMWMSFANEYDYNRRTAVYPRVIKIETLEKNQPNSHTITVGDLCFVTLGQIVNRNFNATRYQPSGGLMVNSPTYSESLRNTIRKEWTGLTAETHRQLLISDFQNPDHEDRRIGAYQRLAFYYPADVEALVLKQLAVLTYDIFVVEKLLREHLYIEESKKTRAELFNTFLAENGPAALEGVERYLFEDLDTQIADEEGRVHPPLERPYRAREILVELYGFPKTVKPADEPAANFWQDAAMARFIAAITHDKSEKIDAAVREILAKNKNDRYIANACVIRLKHRDFAAEARAHKELIDSVDAEYRKVVEKLLTPN